MPIDAGTAYVDIVGNFAPLNRQIARMGGVSAKASASFSRSMKVVERDADHTRRQVARLSAVVARVGTASRGSSQQLAISLRQVETSSERALRALRNVERAQRSIVAAGSRTAGGRSAGSGPAGSPAAKALIPPVVNAATQAAYETAAQRATSRSGLGKIATSGKTIAKSFAGNFAKGLAPGLASAGIEHILNSALSGDMRSAGFEAGGALVGGLLGAFGGPAGAMVGVGLGAFAGDLGEKAFDSLFSVEKKLSPLQQRLQEGSKHVVASFKRQRAAARGLAQAYANLQGAERRQRQSTGAVHRAEQRLSRDRRKFGADSNRVRRDEILLARAKRRNAAATKEVNQVQRLSGASLKLYNHLTVVAASSTKLRIRDLRKEADSLFKKWQQDKSNNDLAKRAQQRYSELNREQTKLSSLYREAGAKSGPKLQRTIEKLTLVQATYGRRLKGLSVLQEHLPHKTESTTEKTLRNWGHFTDVFKRRTAGPFKGDIRSMNKTAATGMVGTATVANRLLAAMGVDTAKFGINNLGEVVEKQRGGFIVPGSGTGDSFSTRLPAGSFILNRRATAAFGLQRGGEVPVLLEPGERAFMPREVRRLGEGNLEAMNRAVPRFQRGGKLREPQMTGPEGALRAVGQGAIHKVYEGAKEYIAKNRPKGFRGLGGAPGQLGAVERLAAKMGLQMTSGYRPGDDGFHGVNRARDFSNSTGPTPEMMRFALAVAKRWGRRLLELIYSPLGWSIDNGRKVPPYAVAEHYNHVHVAMQRGGLLGAPVQKLATGGNVAGMVGPILLRNGLDIESAAGILGNAWQESTWNPGAIEPGTHNGGLWGFTAPPKDLASMKAYAQKQGVPWTNAKAQTQFMLHLLPQSMRSAMNAMDAVEGTTAYFMNEWERPDPAYANLPRRVEGAKKALRILEAGGAATGEVEAEKPIPKQVKGSRTKETYEVVPGKKGRPDKFRATRKKRNYKVATAPLEFGSLPETLPGCTKELRRRQAQLGDYRDALRDEEDAAVKDALQKNVKRLEGRISELKQRRMELLGRKALSRISEAAEFKHWTDPTSGVFAQKLNEREELAERADQAVTLEPEEPTNVTADWVNNTLKKYVEGTETEAYGKVLQTEIHWRNAILRAEEEARGRIGIWDKRVDEFKDRIERIYGYRKKGQENAWEKNKGQIPGLKEKIAALRANIKKTRQETLPEWGEALNELQGRGRPREVLPASAFAAETPGAFGGSIFETQWTIKGLGLKVSQALENVSSEGDQNTEERNALLEELLRHANQRTGVAEAQFATLRDFNATYPVGQFPPYAGKAHSGAVVPGPPNKEKTMIVRGQERIRTPEQELAMAEKIRGQAGGDGAALPQLVVNGNIVQEPGDTRDPVEAIINDRRFPVAVRRVAMGGRLTPGGARS